MLPVEREALERAPAVAAAMRAHLAGLVGAEDVGGIELLALMRALMHVYQLAEAQGSPPGELSGPRWAVLIRLAAHERSGAEEALTPTALSRFHGVSKNAISWLLRGLEEQGYIERALDPDDYRAFRIQLTPAGRELVRSTAPGHLANINRLASGLSTEERGNLIALMEKLYRSVLANI